MSKPEGKTTTNKDIEELEKRVDKMPDGPTKEAMKRDLELKKQNSVTK